MREVGRNQGRWKLLGTEKWLTAHYENPRREPNLFMQTIFCIFFFFFPQSQEQWKVCPLILRHFINQALYSNKVNVNLYKNLQFLYYTTHSEFFYHQLILSNMSGDLAFLLDSILNWFIILVIVEQIKVSWKHWRIFLCNFTRNALILIWVKCFTDRCNLTLWS